MKIINKFANNNTNNNSDKNIINFFKGAVATMAMAFLLTASAFGTVELLSPDSTAEASHRVDRHFVDSLDGTGYYVDVKTINIDGNEVTADVYMVKALYDSMYCYGVVFNLEEQSYQYTYTKIYEYTTRKLTSYSEVPSMAFGYSNAAIGNNMVMAEVLRFCQSYRPDTQNLMNNTDVGEFLE